MQFWNAQDCLTPNEEYKVLLGAESFSCVHIAVIAPAPAYSGRALKLAQEIKVKSLFGPLPNALQLDDEHHTQYALTI